MRLCTKCKEKKPNSDFYGMQSECKKCIGVRHKKYDRTKMGLATRIYSFQRRNSKRREHPMPNYTLDELREWLSQQRKFHVLFDKWEKSGYKKNLIPGCDRLNDYKPYTFYNMQIMAWGENNKKAYEDRKRGLNNKTNKAVYQYNSNWEFVKDYFSVSQAKRETGIHRSAISKSCGDLRYTASGFHWRYAESVARLA